MTLARRSFITGLISLVAAPAIVRAGSLMPVKVLTELQPDWPMSGTHLRVMLDAQREINLRHEALLCLRRWISLDEAQVLFPSR